MAAVSSMPRRASQILAMVGGLLAPGVAVAGPLPHALASLPDDAPFALRAQHLHRAWSDIAQLARSLDWEAVADVLSTLAGPGGLESTAPEMGLDPEGPVVLAPDANLESLLVSLPVRDPRRWIEWLEAHTGSRALRLKSREHLSFIIPVAVPGPVLCGVGTHHAACQIGPAAGDPSGLQAYLRRLDLHIGTRKWAGDRRLAKAWAQLAPGTWHLLARPAPTVRAAEALVRRHPMLAGPLASPDLVSMTTWALEQADAAARASKVWGATLRSEGNLARAVLLAWTTPEHGPRDLPRSPPDANLRRWASTPAAFRLYMRSGPGRASRLLRALGIDVPPHPSGELGLLVYGVKDRCPKATRPNLTDLFHHAVAVGLDRHPRQPAPSPLRSDSSLVVVEDLMLTASGPLGARAAVRRLRYSQRTVLRPPEAFLEASLDLGALAASMEAHRPDHPHPNDLRLLERLRHVAHRLQFIRMRARRMRAGVETEIELEGR